MNFVKPEYRTLHHSEAGLNLPSYPGQAAVPRSAGGPDFTRFAPNTGGAVRFDGRGSPQEQAPLLSFWRNHGLYGIRQKLQSAANQQQILPQVVPPSVLAPLRRAVIDHGAIIVQQNL